MITKPESEIVFEWWADELVKLGYIDNILHHPRTFNLTPKQNFEYTEMRVMKNGIKQKNGTGFLMYEWTYTPDYWIEWNRSAHGILHYPINSGHNLKETIMLSNHDLVAGKNVSLVECKPDYQFRKEEKLFSLKQKAMYAIHGLYVNKFLYPSMFKKTFDPIAYLHTEKQGKLRAEYIRRKPRTVKEFIEIRKEWHTKKFG